VLRRPQVSFSAIVRLVEAFELNVPLVSTVNNYADFFTKTLKPGSFSSMRNKIMNIKSAD
jgi:hypothetical protein